MSRTIRFLMCAGMLTVGAISSKSQPITIDSNDVKSMFAVGVRTTSHYDSLTTSVDIGSPGGPTIWNFSGLNTTKLVIRTSVPVQTSPYAAEFSQATVAVLDTAFAYRLNTGTLGLGWGTVKSTAAYLYYSMGDALRYYGIGAVASGFLDSAPTFPITITNPRWVNRPPSVEYRFPLELSKSWTSNFADSLLGSISFLGNFDVKVGNTDSVTYIVDAYGTLMVPGGHSQEALRIRKIGKYSYIRHGQQHQYPAPVHIPGEERCVGGSRYKRYNRHRRHHKSAIRKMEQSAAHRCTDRRGGSFDIRIGAELSEPVQPEYDNRVQGRGSGFELDQAQRVRHARTRGCGAGERAEIRRDIHGAV